MQPFRRLLVSRVPQIAKSTDPENRVRPWDTSETTAEIESHGRPQNQQQPVRSSTATTPSRLPDNPPTQPNTNSEFSTVHRPRVTPQGTDQVPNRGLLTQPPPDPTPEQEPMQRRQEAFKTQLSTHHPIEELTVLPSKIEHPQLAEYFDSEVRGRPKYLWDSHQHKTVLAQDHMFVEGYNAISYTWGICREGWREVPGVPWRVPKTKGKISIDRLISIMNRMPSRYFWVDVLCVPQDPRNSQEREDMAREIAKQSAVYREAKGVLIYLWTLETGALLAQAMQELLELRRWYWQIVVSQDFQAETKHNGRKPLVDIAGRILRADPWFSSQWILQEMILAPHSVWVSQDGSFCRVRGQIQTTSTVADRFEDFLIREQIHDSLGSGTPDPARNYVQSNIPESEVQSREILTRWHQWAFTKAGITTCRFASRASVVLNSLKRPYLGRREPSLLGALKVGDDDYDKGTALVHGISPSLWNAMIRLENGRFFDCANNSDPLTDMLPALATYVGYFNGIRVICENWVLRDNGEMEIPQGSAVNWFPKGRETEYQFHDKTIFGGDPEETVKKHLAGVNIKIKHVRFITIGYQPDYRPRQGGEFQSTGTRGVILVTTSGNVHAKGCRWYKAGMYFSVNYQKRTLEHDIIVGRYEPIQQNQIRKL